MTSAALDELAFPIALDLESHSFSRSEIISFAERFDPQAFHLDEAAARDSLFGGLCASGWHVLSTFLKTRNTDAQSALRKIVGSDRLIIEWEQSLSDLRWMQPVFVDDLIQFRLTLQKADALTGTGHFSYVGEAVKTDGSIAMQLQSQVKVTDNS